MEVWQLHQGDEMKPPRCPPGSGQTSEHRQGPSAKGIGSAGVPFNPAGIAVEREPRKSDCTVPQAAPSPGVPIPTEHFERLKRDARTTRTPPSKHSQEDLSGKEG
jgi:hypothetical protein